MNLFWNKRISQARQRNSSSAWTNHQNKSSDNSHRPPAVSETKLYRPPEQIPLEQEKQTISDDISIGLSSWANMDLSDHVPKNSKNSFERLSSSDGAINYGRTARPSNTTKHQHGEGVVPKPKQHRRQMSDEISFSPSVSSWGCIDIDQINSKQPYKTNNSIINSGIGRNSRAVCKNNLNKKYPPPATPTLSPASLRQSKKQPQQQPNQLPMDQQKFAKSIGRGKTVRQTVVGHDNCLRVGQWSNMKNYTPSLPPRRPRILGYC